MAKVSGVVHPNDTAAGRRRNRRVEIVVTGEPIGISGTSPTNQAEVLIGRLPGFKLLNQGVFHFGIDDLPGPLVCPQSFLPVALRCFWCFNIQLGSPRR